MNARQSDRDISTIPILIGITGHRRIREEDQDALYLSVKTELGRLLEQYPDSPAVMLSSLAEGGDLLCAEAGNELGIPLLAALPMPLEEYEKDFSDAARERLHFHCGRADEVFCVPYTETVPEGGVSRDFLFRQAGIYVASRCHILIALWDGGPGTEAACGTAEAVGFALSGDYVPSGGVSLPPDNNAQVWQIFTPRGERTGEKAGTVHVLGDRETIRGILKDTEEFNRQARKIETGGKSRLPEKQTEDVKLQRMEQVSLTAGKLSSQYAAQFKKVLMLLAVAGTMLTFAFLLYDEVELIGMIFLCGIMLLWAWSIQRSAVRSDCHRRYIEYRALAECLRVQTYLRYAGTDLQAADLLTWTQQEETAWIRNAVSALSAGSAPEQSHEIRTCWVEDQRKYHEQAGKRSLRSFRVSENVVRAALAASVGVYFAAVLFELLCGGSFFAPVFAVRNLELCRVAIKVSLGTISVVTLFISGYFGKLSLPRTLSDHRKMERFYSRMNDQLLRHGQTREILTNLAREELIENGNWCSYQRDNTPDINF